MKTLESYIRQHAGNFDMEEPLEGHLQRFESRLDGHRRLVRRRELRFAMLRFAAALAAAVAIGALMYSESGVWDKVAENYAMRRESNELAEAEQYYAGQYGMYAEKIRTLEFKPGELERDRVLRELEDMDQQIRLMKRDLRQNPGNEMIVNAIIGFHQTRLELMNSIASRMEDPAGTLL